MMIKERFIDPFTDFGFKKLFGSEISKDLLIDFLSELLHIRIRKLSFAKNEHLGKIFKSRIAVFDLHCVSEKEERFIIELQKAKQVYFKDRSIYYSTFPIQDQARKGEWNYRLEAVYTISVMDFVFDNQRHGQFLHKVKLTEESTKEVFYDKLTFIYLEMPKFNKVESELATHFDKWMYLLKNLNKFIEIPSILQEKVFQELFKIAEIVNLNKEEMNAYERELMRKRDWKNVLDTAIAEATEKGMERGMEKGIEKGLMKGMEKGRIERTLVIARQMKSEGLPPETISRITDLSLEEIERL